MTLPTAARRQEEPPWRLMSERARSTDLSPHGSDQHDEVIPLELFFDLVFVFAVSQLSHHLLTHLTWRGAAVTLVLLLAVYAVWFSSCWQATVSGADDPRIRRMLLTVLLLGLFMNAAVIG